jgi:hypothetical protein
LSIATRYGIWIDDSGNEPVRLGRPRAHHRSNVHNAAKREEPCQKEPIKRSEAGNGSEESFKPVVHVQLAVQLVDAASGVMQAATPQLASEPPVTVAASRAAADNKTPTQQPKVKGKNAKQYEAKIDRSQQSSTPLTSFGVCM